MVVRIARRELGARKLVAPRLPEANCGLMSSWVLLARGIRRGQEGPRLVFVPVAEAKGGKDRVHLDIVATDCSQVAELDRLLALGASVVDDRRQAEGGGWVVLADPEGNEFCLEGD
jgi:hypothetical protein